MSATTKLRSESRSASAVNPKPILLDVAAHRSDFPIL